MPPTPPPHGIFHNVPAADDGRTAFPVSHEELDAPDGAVLNLCDLIEERHGWYQRQGTSWVPVADPLADDVTDHYCPSHKER